MRKFGVFGKLRRRFLLINMAAIAAVLVSVLVSVYVVTNRSSVAQAQNILAHLIEDVQVKEETNVSLDGGAVPGELDAMPPRKPMPEAGGRGKAVLRISKSGEVVEIISHNDDFDQSTFDALAKQAVAKDKEETSASISGVFYQLRMRADPQGGYILAMLDDSRERATLHTLLSVCLITGVSSFALVFVISLYLSRRAVKPAEDAWERQREFIADAAHELKTPLAVIRANTDALNANPAQSVKSQRKWIGYIQEETARMTRLVRDLLFLAGADDPKGWEKPDKQLQEVDFSRLVQDALLQFEAVFYERSILLQGDNITPSLFCAGDESRLEQLVMILFDNVVQHAAQDAYCQVSLFVCGNKIVLDVTNTAMFIAQEDLNRVFERFYRLDKARARSSGGYGLGLSIAKAIVMAHDGSVEAFCQPQEGERSIVTFRVCLPLHDASGQSKQTGM